MRRIFQHPLYNNRTEFDYDFSVIELDRLVDCSDHVSPICLPQDTTPPGDFDGRWVDPVFTAASF